MSEQRPDPNSEYESDDRDFSSRLKVRLAIAGGLVAIALAAIPVLDSLTGKPPTPAPAAAVNEDSNSGKIVASNGEAVLAPPATASAPDSSAPQASAPAAEAAPGAPQGPDISKTPGMQAARPLVQAPPPTQTAPPPRRELAPRPPQATLTRPVAQAPFSLAHAPVSAAPPAPRPVAPAHTAATLPPATATAPAITPSPAAERARPQATSVGYTVQLGLFSNMGNAQKMLEELKSHGIAAHSETRVQLGPFRSRAEADEAIAKLKALGYTPLLAPAGGN